MTEERRITCKSAASPSGLPSLSWALNPYRGCSHACRYCYAQDVTRFEMNRDWGEVVEVKLNFVQMLHKQLEKKPTGTFGLGTVTDPYQPIEGKYELSRGSLKELSEARAQVSILTKSNLILRDLDLLSGWDGAEVGLSIGSIDERVTSLIEPGAPHPDKRLAALKALSVKGVDTYAMVAPVIPGVSDSDESLRLLVRRVAETGTKRIIWDKYNSKVLAGARLRRSLSTSSMKIGESGTEWLNHARGILAAECESRGIQLLDAF